MLWDWLRDWWPETNRRRGGVVRPRRGEPSAPSIPAMVEYLESRELLSGGAPDTPADNSVASWQAPVADTVVVHGDLWGNGQQALIRFDSATGEFHAEWKSGDGIANGVIASWVPGMDLQYLTVQDLNHDGRADLMAMDRNTGRWAASTSLPNGQYSTRFVGTWQPGEDWQSVTFADINADGWDDVIGLNRTTDMWHTLFGGSDIFQETTFVSPISTSNIASVIVDDFDGAAGADIVMRDAVSGSWTSVSSLGTGFTSTTVGNWSSTETWVDINAIDFWGTGRSGLIGRNSQTNEWQLTWSAGSGYATAQLSIWALGDYADAQVVDVNLDGREDLLARQVTTGRWYTLSSTPSSVQTELTGTWTPNATYANVWHGDFNGDAKVDLIGLDSNLKIWQGLVSTSGASYTAQSFTNPEFDFRPTNLAVGDFDFDGYLDVIGRGAGTENWQTIALINGQFTASRFNAWSAYATGAYDRFGIDFNGDSDADFLARDTVTGDWWLTSETGVTPTVSKIENWNPETAWESMLSLDIDGNGTEDVVARDANTGNWQLLRSVNGVVTSKVIGHWTTAVAWTDFQVADLLGNGKPMIVARDPVSNHWQGLWNAGGGFSSSILNGLAVGRTYVDSRVVSFFGDGRQAVVTRDLQSGTWYAMWIGSNQFRLTNLGTWPPGGMWESVVTADLQGTGRQALYGHDAVSGEWRQITFDGVTAVSSVVAQSEADHPLELTSVGNFRDAARDTILVRDVTTRSWKQLAHNGTGFEFVDLGQWSDTAAWTTTWIRDYNRDGRADLFGAASTTGTWSVRTDDGPDWRTMQVPGGTLDQTLVPVPDDTELKNEIMARTPGLEQALQNGDTFDVANALLNWTAQNVGDAMYQSDADAALPIVAGKPVSYSFYRLFRPDRGAVFCGGYALIYQKLLLSFGIDALVIDYGDTNAGLTHMSVVIPQQQSDGGWQFYQFDPTLNFRCTDATTGALLGLFDVMDRERSNQLGSVTILQGSNAGRDWVGSLPSEDSRFTFQRMVGGRYVYHRDDYSLSAHLSDYSTEFANAGFTLGPAGFFEMQQREFFTVRIGNNQDSRNAFLQELQNRQIPVRYPDFQ